jgi:hypothetical protein
MNWVRRNPGAALTWVYIIGVIALIVIIAVGL